MCKFGLVEYFCYVEIVFEKDECMYELIFCCYVIVFENFLMVGNLFKFDIVFVFVFGGFGVYVLYYIMWVYEYVENVLVVEGWFFVLKSVCELLVVVVVLICVMG